MIACTNSCALLVQQVCDKSTMATQSIESFCSIVQYDPALRKTKIEAFILSAQDIKSNKIKNEVIKAFSLHHKDAHIIFIVADKKRVAPDLMQAAEAACDAILVKPKAANLKQALDAIASKIEQRSEIASSMNVAQEIPIEEYKPEIPVAEEPEPFTPPQEQVVLPEPEPEPEPSSFAPPPTDFVGDDYATRIRNTQRMVDLTAITKELTVHSLIKRIAESNAQFTVIEEKLTSLQNKIYAIMADPDISRIEDKLHQVRAVLEDKQYYCTQNSTIIEQTVSNIIDVLTSKTVDLVKERLTQLDEAILKVKAKGSPEDTVARLGGIQDERASCILELATMQEEIQAIAGRVDSIAIDSVSHISGVVSEMTNHALLDNQIKRMGTPIVPEAVVEIINRIISSSTASIPEFKELLISVKNMQNKLNRIFELDREEIAAQQAVIQYLKANKIEDTVVAKTLLKRALRVFVGKQGTGMTVITSTLSHLKAATNANTLLVDLSGNAKYDQYGISYIDLEDFINQNHEHKLCVVKASRTIDSPDYLVRIFSALERAADFYRVINVVIDVSQLEVFQTIASQVLSINYIVDDITENVDNMKRIIESTRIENVAQRVILSKSQVPLATMIERLGLKDRIDFATLEVPYMKEVPYCAWRNIPPYSLSIVEEQMLEVSKYA